MSFQEEERERLDPFFECTSENVVRILQTWQSIRFFLLKNAQLHETVMNSLFIIQYDMIHT